MSFHDDLADKAYAMGKRSKDFEKAAQDHSNAFWFFGVAAGLVAWLAPGKWWIAPALLAAWSAWKCVSSTMVRVRLELIENAFGTSGKKAG